MDLKFFFQKIRRRLWIINRIGYKRFGRKVLVEKPLVIRGKHFISINDGTTILRNARIECICTYGNQDLSPDLVIGKDCYIGYNFQCLVTTQCNIGNNCLLASNILITTENHGMDPTKLYVNQQLISKEVYIGNNVWIGERVIILPGAKIGNNCIIGAGSIVNSSIPDNCIAVGSPATIKKKYNLKEERWEVWNMLNK